MKIDKLTPILVVDAIEPALAFWTGALGYEKVVEVPHEGRLGFVLLQKDGHEVMLQTKASIAADLPAMAGTPCALYADVKSIQAAQKAVGEHATVIAGPRETFYGAREVWVRDPAGNVIGFAESKK